MIIIITRVKKLIKINQAWQWFGENKQTNTSKKTTNTWKDLLYTQSFLSVCLQYGQKDKSL